jgi:hypothetical protein
MGGWRRKGGGRSVLHRSLRTIVFQRRIPLVAADSDILLQRVKCQPDDLNVFELAVGGRDGRGTCVWEGREGQWQLQINR